MVDAAAPQSLGIEVFLQGVHLDHRIADRRASGEHDAVAGMAQVEVPCLHREIESTLAAAGLDAGDSFHLGRCLQVLEVVGFVDKQVIDAEFVEHEPVVLLVLGEQLLQALFAFHLLLLDGLDDVAVGTGGIAARAVAKQLFVIPDLLGEELLLVRARMPMRSNEEWVTMMPSHPRWRFWRSGACVVSRQVSLPAMSSRRWDRVA